METGSQTAFTQDEVTAIIRRALTAQGSQGSATYAELEEIALQSGVSPWALQEAVALEQEARDLAEAKALVRPAQDRFWLLFGVVQVIALLVIAATVASGAYALAIAGWTAGSGIGVLLVRAAQVGVERRTFRKVQERRARREAAGAGLQVAPGAPLRDVGTTGEAAIPMD